MENNFRVAVKAFIVRDGKLLTIKRRSNDVHKPGEWDIPGGRLEFGENPLTGVKRESLEEVGMTVDPVMPIAVQHFTRDDGQQITMIIFWCQTADRDVTLSEEHTDFQWLPVSNPSQFSDWIRPIVEQFNRHIKFES